MPHDVFLSYAEPDRATTHAICATLESRRVRCWYAPRDVLHGQDWSEAIITAINDAKIMVLVFSAHTNDSAHVPRELERAVHNRLHIIPFRLQDIPPSAKLEYYISTHHWLDAITPPVQAHIDELAETISVILNRFEGEAVSVPPPSDGRSIRKGLLAAGVLLAALVATVLMWPRDSRDRPEVGEASSPLTNSRSPAAPSEGPKELKSTPDGPSKVAHPPNTAEPMAKKDLDRSPVAETQRDLVPSSEDRSRHDGMEAATAKAGSSDEAAQAVEGQEGEGRLEQGEQVRGLKGSVRLRLHSRASSRGGRGRAEALARKITDNGWNVQLFFVGQLPKETFFESFLVSELRVGQSFVFYPADALALLPDLQAIFPAPDFRYEARSSDSRQAKDERDLTRMIDVVGNLTKLAQAPDEIVPRTWKRPSVDSTFQVRLHSRAGSAGGRRDTETFQRRLESSGWNVKLFFLHGRSQGYFEDEAAADFKRKPLSDASWVFYPVRCQDMGDTLAPRHG